MGRVVEAGDHRDRRRRLCLPEVVLVTTLGRLRRHRALLEVVATILAVLHRLHRVDRLPIVTADERGRDRSVGRGLRHLRLGQVARQPEQTQGLRHRPHGRHAADDLHSAMTATLTYRTRRRVRNHLRRGVIPTLVHLHLFADGILVHRLLADPSLAHRHLDVGPYHAHHHLVGRCLARLLPDAPILAPHLHELVAPPQAVAGTHSIPRARLTPDRQSVVRLHLCPRDPAEISRRGRSLCLMSHDPSCIAQSSQTMNAKHDIQMVIHHLTSILPLRTYVRIPLNGLY